MSRLTWRTPTLIGAAIICFMTGCATLRLPAPYLGATSVNDSRFQKQIAEARLMEQRSELVVAEQSYQELARRFPDHPDVHQRLGIVAQKRGNQTEAIRHLKKAHELAPHDAEVLGDLGYSLYLAGDFAQSIEMLRRAQELNPTHPRIQTNLAMALVGAGDVPTAHRLFSQNVDKADSFVSLGFALAQHGKPQDARQAFEKALELDPQKSKAAEALIQLTDTPSSYPKAPTNLARLGVEVRDGHITEAQSVQVASGSRLPETPSRLTSGVVNVRQASQMQMESLSPRQRASGYDSAGNMMRNDPGQLVDPNVGSETERRTSRPSVSFASVNPTEFPGDESQSDTSPQQTAATAEVHRIEPSRREISMSIPPSQSLAVTDDFTNANSDVQCNGRPAIDGILRQRRTNRPVEARHQQTGAYVSPAVKHFAQSFQGDDPEQPLDSGERESSSSVAIVTVAKPGDGRSALTPDRTRSPNSSSRVFESDVRTSQPVQAQQHSESGLATVWVPVDDRDSAFNSEGESRGSITNTLDGLAQSQSVSIEHRLNDRWSNAIAHLTTDGQAEGALAVITDLMPDRSSTERIVAWKHIQELGERAQVAGPKLVAQCSRTTGQETIESALAIYRIYGWDDFARQRISPLTQSPSSSISDRAFEALAIIRERR